MTIAPNPEQGKQTTYNIQLIREVVDSSYDGVSTKRIERLTAQITWDTPDGQAPPTPSGHSFAGDWRIVE